MKTQKYLLGLLLTALMLFCLSVPANAEAFDDSTYEARLAENDVHYTITSETTILEGTRFIMTIDAGVYVPDTTVEDFEKLYDLLEETTGLKFLTKNDKTKVNIEVERTEGESEAGSAYGGEGVVHLSPMDILVREGEGWVPIHESLHCLNAKNGNMLSKIMAEGWTTHFTEVILTSENYPFYSEFNSSSNYSYLKCAINASNAEKIFCEIEKEPETYGWDGWDAYLYGYRFLSFLSKEYGDKAIVDFYTDPQFRGGSDMYTQNGGYKNDPVYVDKLISKMKAAFGKDVFKKFGKWMQSSNGFEAGISESVDCTKIGRVIAFPYFGYEPMYSFGTMKIGEEITFDFKSGNEYLEKYKGYKNERIEGYLEYTNPGTLYFYDSCGTLLEKVSLDCGEESYFGGYTKRFSVDGAELMVIRGEGSTIDLRLDFKAMNSFTAAPEKADATVKKLKKDDSFTDKDTKAVYKVTKTGNSPEVRYMKTTGKNDSAVRIPDSVKYKGVTYKVTSVSAKALKGNKSIKTLYIGANVKNIYSYAFNGCKSLKTIFIENPGEIKLGKAVYKGISKNAVFLRVATGSCGIFKAE